MKILFNSFLLVAVAMIFASCGRDAGSSPLDVVGDNAVAVITINPKAIAESMGETALSGEAMQIPVGRNVSDIFGFFSKSGLDLDCGVIVKYEGSRDFVGIIRIDDRWKFDRSMDDAGYSCATYKGFDVFSPTGRAVSSCHYVIDGDMLWMMSANTSSGAANEVKNLKENSADGLSSWKRDFLTGSAAINAVISNEDRLVKMFVDFSGNKMNIEAVEVDENGRKTDFEYGDCEPLAADVAQSLYSDNLLSFALAKGNYSRLLEEISKHGFLEISRSQRSMITASVAGPVFGNLNVDLPIQGLEDLHANLRVTAKSPETADLMSVAARNELEYQGISGVVNVSVENDVLGFATDGVYGTEHVAADEIEGCIIWANVNIPAEMLETLTGKGLCGIKARASWRADSFRLAVELPGSNAPFLASILELIKR